MPYTYFLPLKKIPHVLKNDVQKMQENLAKIECQFFYRYCTIWYIKTIIISQHICKCQVKIIIKK